ncbi:MAG: energy-coupling factor transporter transmembrane protein EcfT [Syntrophomonadaceae bacterium]|nr:energy-coupling factor transporter transmembrane protein EcfT [Syntrophomonadaceae bacterium]
MNYYNNTTFNRPSIIKGFFPGLTYLDNNSRLHRIHPLVKLVWLVCFSFTCFAAASCLAGIILFCLLLIAYGLAGMSPGFFLRKLRFILIFGIFILLIQILTVESGVLLWRLNLGSASLSVWSEGLLGGLGLMLRFINIIGSSYLFVATTDPNRLAYSLMEAGLPYRFGFMLITALRFIPVFYLELEQVKNAQMAKGIDMEGLSPRKLIKAVRYLLIPLVISALGKVDYLTISMENRAFGLYSTRSYMYSQALSRNDLITILVSPVGFLLFSILVS